MAVYIEQTPDQVKRSFNVQRHAEIIDVRLFRAAVNSGAGPFDSENVTGKVNHRSTAASVDGQFLRIDMEFGLTATPADDESVTVFSVQCEFRVTYLLDDDYQPTAEETESFSNANAIFNAWPYFRELAQNLSARMNMPTSPVIPFLKLVPEKEDKAEVAGVEPSAETRSFQPKRQRRKLTTQD